MTYVKTILLISLVLIIPCCSESKKEKPQSKINLDKKDTVKIFSVYKVGELRFRRSYADNQFRDMPEKEYDSIQKSNPRSYENSGTNFLKKFREFDLVNKDYELLRHKFKSNKTKDFELTANGKERVVCKIVRPENINTKDLYYLVLSADSRSIKTTLEGHYGILNEDIKYLIYDIIPGGYKEIIILYEYYIMNGDNSDVFIYEVINNY